VFRQLLLRLILQLCNQDRYILLPVVRGLVYQYLEKEYLSEISRYKIFRKWCTVVW